MRWGLRTALRAGCVCTGALAAAAVPASSAAGPPARVRIGAVPHLARDARVIGTLAAGARLHVTVVLKVRDPAGLAAYARAVSTPGSSLYRDYLTPARFAELFGPTLAQVRAVQESLRSHGLRPGPVSVNRLAIPVADTAGRLGRAFSLSFRRLILPGRGEATVASSAPALDATVAGDVQSVLGLSSTEAFHPQARRPSILRPSSRSLVRPRAIPHVDTGGPQPCQAASSQASAQGAYTADQIASAYGFPALYRAGDQGQGQTVAIYELEPNDPADISAYQTCYGTNAPVSDIQVDGGVGTGPGSGEAALDIENAIGLAPRATYLVYQAPNSQSNSPGSGPYDLFSRIITDDRAQVVSVSWGQCEQLMSADATSAENTLFQEAAAQGQSIVSASGDEGSEDCNGSSAVPSPQLAVDDPASQPYVTGVGGTTLRSLGPPPAESVWNNGGNPLSLTGVTGGAGGGGVSQLWGMPAYQSGSAGSLNVIQTSSSGAPCGASPGDCRQVPDVSADADPSTGYIVYWNGSRSDPTSPQGWQAVGGTSAAAPMWAALLTAVNASGACHGSPVGFANPALYRVADAAYASYFNDVTSGNNDFLGTNGGLYPAGRAYDMASGLGTPNAGALADGLCGGALRIVNPGSQTATVGTSVTLQMRTTGPVTGTLGWGASGLPPGLSISRSSGRISGRPGKAGIYTATVAAADASAAVRDAVFTWTVAGIPTVARSSLSGVSAGHPKLSVSVRAGAFAPALTSLTITTPAGLSFGRGKGLVTVTGLGGRRVRFSTRASGSRLRVSFASPQTQVVLTVRYTALRASSGLSSRIRSRRVRKVLVTVSAVDARRRATTIRVRIPTK